MTGVPTAWSARSVWAASFGAWLGLVPKQESTGDRTGEVARPREANERGP
jgi:transposase